MHINISRYISICRELLRTWPDFSLNLFVGILAVLLTCLYFCVFQNMNRNFMQFPLLNILEAVLTHIVYIIIHLLTEYFWPVRERVDCVLLTSRCS